MNNSAVLIILGMLCVCAALVFMVLLKGEQMNACAWLFGLGVMSCLAGCIMYENEEA